MINSIRPLLAESTVNVDTGTVVRTGGAGGSGGILNFTSFRDFAESLIMLADQIMPILLGVALVVFLYGMVKYVGSASSESDKTAGKEIIVWGILALSVMVGMWGFVFIVRTFFFGTDGLY